ncbi:MAG: MerR family transcriptional regulator [Candidatus Omnitrophota bacterium]
MKNIYLLKDLSQITGYSTHTLKYYLRLGLFKEIGRSPSTNFRYFDDTSVDRLKEIKTLRTRGIFLKSIARQLESRA